MTDEQKEILIAKMLDAPSSLSDEELDAIVQDEELREIYEVSSAVSSASVPQPEIDVEQEWQRFRPLLHRRPARIKLFLRVAAVIMGAMLISGIVALVLRFNPEIEKQPLMTELTDSVTTGPAITPETTQPVNVIKVENLPTVMNPDGNSGTSKTVIAKTEPKHKETVRSNNLDIDEYLRVQQARVDNDLAMQRSEVIKDEFEVLKEIYNILGEDDELVDNTIRRVTMQ